MKNFKVSKKIVAIFLVAAMATVFFAGCKEGNNERSKVESTVESFEENSIDESETSIEVRLAESNPIVSAESSEEASVVDEGSTVIEESIEESVVESEVESLVEESVDDLYPNHFTIESLESASFDDITRYGKITSNIKIDITSLGGSQTFMSGEIVPIISIDEDKYVLYCFSYSIPLDSSLVELFPEDYVPDYSSGLWNGVEEKYMTN